MKTLKYNEQVKVEGFKFQPVIKVWTQKGMFKEYGWDYKEKKDEPYAWTSRSPSCLTADYPGKDAEMAKKKQDYEDATILVDDETVQIDNRYFKVLVAGENYSDPIHFRECREKEPKRKLWEVFKDDFQPSVPWRVQGPKAIVGFRLKRDAKAFSDGNKLIDEKIALSKEKGWIK